MGRFAWLIFFVLMANGSVFSQDKDTILLAIINPYDNTRNISDLNEVPVVFRAMANDRARSISEHELEVAQKLDNTKMIASALNNLGLIYLRYSKPAKALEYFNNCLMDRKSLGDKKGMGVVLANIGFATVLTGDMDKAAEYYSTALKIFNEVNYTQGMAIVNDFSGQAEYEAKDYKSAKAFFLTAKNFWHSLGNAKEEDRMKRNADLVVSKEFQDKIKSQPAATDAQPDASSNDTVQKNQRNADFFPHKHRYESGNGQQNIEHLIADNAQHNLTLTEDELLLKMKKDSMEVQRLKNEHEVNDVNLSAQEDSIADAKRAQQIEYLENKINNANKALLVKQLELSNAARQRLWSLLAGVIFILLSLVVYIRYRTKKKDFIELEKAHQELQATRDKLLEAEQFKDQFLANMSHEIRTPMNAIIGATNLVLNTHMDEQQIKYMKAVKQSSENLLVIINDILDLSKIKAGKLEFEHIPFNLKEVLDGVITTMKFRAEEKGLALGSSISDDTPRMLVGDQVRLSQVLLNLVSNAIKFTSNGSVTINCHLKEISDKKATLVFDVIDTGIGIAEDKFEKIFESFSQASTDTTRLYGGTGLGLTISKQLVAMQGGTIGVKSKMGEGTTFTATIPYEIFEGETSSSKVQNTDMESKDKLKNLRILLAEDNAMNQMVATDTLESLIEGVQIDIAENGRIAVEMVQQNPYDIILMDIQMPQMNGYDATLFIREKLSSPLNKIKIMAMTASATKPEVDKCFASGMDDYISKPFDPNELLKKINTLITN
ncbi:MAG: ATP-binding protein [Bacteroidota bacterium]